MIKPLRITNNIEICDIEPVKLKIMDCFTIKDNHDDINKSILDRMNSQWGETITTYIIEPSIYQKGDGSYIVDGIFEVTLIHTNPLSEKIKKAFNDTIQEEHAQETVDNITKELASIHNSKKDISAKIERLYAELVMLKEKENNLLEDYSLIEEKIVDKLQSDFNLS